MFWRPFDILKSIYFRDGKSIDINLINYHNLIMRLNMSRLPLPTFFVFPPILCGTESRIDYVIIIVLLINSNHSTHETCCYHTKEMGNGAVVSNNILFLGQWQQFSASTIIVSNIIWPRPICRSIVSHFEIRNIFPLARYIRLEYNHHIDGFSIWWVQWYACHYHLFHS